MPPSQLRQHNPLLRLVLPLAILVARLANFVRDRNSDGRGFSITNYKSPIANLPGLVLPYYEIGPPVDNLRYLP